MANGNGEQGETAVLSRQEDRVERPRRFKVLLLNDDYTTMDFVVMVLTTVFHHSHEAATEIMFDVHEKGVGIAGIYGYEVAETKVRRVSELAREHQFPLRCTMEAE